MPALSVNSKFDEFDAVKVLAQGHPVYPLRAIDNSTLVIKREDAVGAKLDLKHNLMAMRSAVGTETGKPLSSSEIDTLRDFCQEWADLVVLTGVQEPIDVGRLRHDLGQGGTWYKMNEAPGVMDLKQAIQSLIANGDKTGIKTIAKALVASGGLEALGRVIAADLYNNNTDRFVSDGLGGAQNPRTLTRFIVIQNIGNILLMIENGKLKPSGLDSFESASIYNDVTQTIAAIEANDANMGGGWTGRKLAAGQAAWRVQFCRDVVTDLEDSWGPRNRKIKFASTARLPGNAATRIGKGLDTGIQNIVAHVRFQANKANAPAGLADRLRILTS
jgi:hypothetical protein